MGGGGGSGGASGKVRKVTVLMPADLFTRFDAYCRRGGFKKSTLIARLVRDLLAEAESGDKRRER
jgi:metal-responsive CopG/Arc/MetJ family transcriptional regulator